MSTFESSLSGVGSFAVPASSQSQNLLLDSSIRDWVVLPLLILMIQAGLLRHYLSQLLKPSGAKKIPYVEHRVKNALSRASRLRSAGMGFVSKQKWEGRKAYWLGNGSGTEGYLAEELQWIDEEEEETKRLAKEKSAENGEKADDDMPNPMAMMDGMKGQFLFMFQNMIMMQGIGYFFQGYVLVKVPIPLTMGFKLMFQRGLSDLTTLETSYVSSVSWYFLVMFGLRSFFRLVIEGSTSNKQETREEIMTQADFGNTIAKAGPAAANRFDAKKAIQMEIEHLELTKYKGSSLDDVEKRLLRRNGRIIPKKTSTIGGSAQPGYDIFGVNSSSKQTKKQQSSRAKKSN